MSDHIGAWSEDDADGNAHREPAVDFNWSEVESAFSGYVDSETVEKARSDGGMAMLTALLIMCSENVRSIKRKDQRANLIGVRLLCAAAVMRPGQVTDRRQRDIAAILGVNIRTVERAMAHVRGVLKRNAVG